MVRLFGGRYISFRHPGQPVTEDGWGEVNDTPSARNHRSYANVLTQQPSSQTEHTAYHEDVGEIHQQISPGNEADPAHPPATPAPPSQPSPQSTPAPLPPTTQPSPPAQQPPPAQPHQPPQSPQPPQPMEQSAAILQLTNDSIHQYLKFTPEAALDLEETTTTPLPAHIDRFTIKYFEWLQANTRPSDPRTQNQFINIWHSCITKVHLRNSAPQNPQYNQSPPPSTSQIDQPTINSTSVPKCKKYANNTTKYSNNSTIRRNRGTWRRLRHQPNTGRDYPQGRGVSTGI